ncbi:MAG TPA: glycoside hydrolase family 71/99-like protein [Pirellulales bacterium]|nr:glycoside hydrolase family 71/99-like protein [Pirellulales bacterium]
MRAIILVIVISVAARASAQVDALTLEGKLVCGYQGWFNCAGDGADRGWVHWSKSKDRMDSSTVHIDLWPDMTELGPDERFATAFRHADGSAATVFSSFHRATVLRHFEWMRQYGIDGVMVQRFATGLKTPRVLHHTDTVLAHCREGAKQSGRCYAVMYDLSGLAAGRIDEVIEDWRRLRHDLRVTDDKAYLHHRGKPLVAVWGVGFNDGRAYTLAECRTLVDAMKRDGATVMLGVPTHWRELKGDAIADPELHALIKLADIVSPWTVGRYRTPAEAQRFAATTLTQDLAWCAERKLDYLPVVFPGFSWHNLKGGPINQIPRLRGEFFWSQLTGVRRAEASMVYVAMFDEGDEGTAIFKCTNDVPTGSQFVTYEGLPSDYYLRLAGTGAKLVRGEMSVDTPQPMP